MLAQAPWTIRTIAGGTEAGDGGRAADASIRYLQGVATDATGNIYVSDADDHRLRRIDSSGRISTIAGNGLPGFSGDGGPATQARINTPYGLSVTPTGDIVFADLGNARVRKISRNGVIETLAGGGTKAIPPAGVFISPRDVKLIAPRNVLANSNGSLFISDFGANQVLEIRSDGNLTALPLSAVTLNSPAGLTLDSSGNLLVADSGNARVRRLFRDGRVDVLLSSTNQVPLERPVGLARMPDGSLLVADTRGDYLWKVESDGKAAIMPPGGRDVTVDPFGNIITAGLTWLRRVNPQGIIDILIGPAFSRFRGDGGAALAARLNHPTGVAVDSKGNIYFADTANHRLRKLSTEGIVTTVAGSGEAGYRGDGGLATDSYLNRPTYVAVDAFDNVYLSDTGNHRVRVLIPGGVIQTVCGTGRTEFSNDGIAARSAHLSSPMGLAFDLNGSLFIAEKDHHRIRRIDQAGKIFTVAGTSIRGFSMDGQDALNAMMNAPGAIAIDGQSNLYWADTGNRALRVVDQPTGKIRTIVGDASGIEGIAVSSSGSVYYTDSNRHLVRKIALTGEVTTIAGRANENGFNADSGDATAVTLNEPFGIALAPDKSLIIADKLNDRLRRLEPPAEVLIENSKAAKVVHAATFGEGPLAPGQLASILTSDLTQPTLVEVTLDGIASPVSYAGKSQVNFQVPYAIAGRTKASLELRMAGALLFRTILDVTGANPALFESSGLAVAQYADGSLNSIGRAAKHGETLRLYGTGEGLLRESGGFQVPFLPTSVEIAGQPAELLFAGAAPGYPGLLQINLRIPNDNRIRGKVPVTIRVGAYQNPRTQNIIVD